MVGGIPTSNEKSELDRIVEELEKLGFDVRWTYIDLSKSYVVDFQHPDVKERLRSNQTTNQSIESIYSTIVYVPNVFNLYLVKDLPNWFYLDLSKRRLLDRVYIDVVIKENTLKLDIRGIKDPSQVLYIIRGFYARELMESPSIINNRANTALYK